MNGVPQGLLLTLLLLTISVSDAGRGVEWALSKFASDTSLCGVVHILKGRDAIKGTLRGGPM